MPEPHGHAASHQHGSPADGHDVDPMLDLDAEVLHEYWSTALAWVHQAADRGARHRLLDLGAGTGTGSIGLAQRFGGAEIVAVDVSPASLRRLREKAVDLGLADRIRTVEADLDAGWPDVGSFDVTWASMSLHHFADPTRVLRDVLAATRPGGLIAVAELTEPLRFLPDDLGFGSPGFEARAIAALGAAHAATMPTLGSAWAPRLTDAGWTVVDERDVVIDLDPPQHPDAARYARAWFARLADGSADRLEPDDRTTLAALLDEDDARAPLERAKLHIRGVRTVTLARRRPELISTALG
ncbi:MAG TPA: class I SAM-dependent methyltransferase [Acidimicrobiales bacterium]|nr:class I SAM-dependent methyltransferase [Acidimicrobiales bacterium]